MDRLVLRPAAYSDLPAVERIAGASPVGVTSLPRSRDKLFDKIASSQASLAADVSGCGEESYFFVLEREHDREVVGTAAIVASAGFSEPFYNYRNETVTHASRELGVHHRVHVLTLCHDLTGATLLTSFVLDPAYKHGDYPDLLSRARMLFIAAHRQRFADHVVSEMLGLCDDDGHAPFWDSVGRHFFGIDYPLAEFYCGVKGRSFIAELLPQHPIYVPLLPREAQEAIGQIHPFSRLPCEILLREGFETERYVDIFDAGAVVQARTEEIRTVATHARATVVGHPPGADGTRYLVANLDLPGFRAILTDAAFDSERGEVWLAEADLKSLNVTAGGSVVLAPL
ncbi:MULTISPECIES: arginine N-succinyltransferase [Niveibacterium]|uniref:Arginine N-succinyltransferase n=1 Tax=Niveibacterium microcysteis TaxID=2811415 RepID=A0ABX7M4H9_9RHOO|nr:MULTISPECIES: arginine N-succinyltransferase [Niveibacterium]QSI75673.1 arginine N-succinyltransferase [Niveibacterium microcysteis]